MTNLQRLSPPDAAAELLLRRKARASLAEWAKLNGFQPARHHTLLLNRLEAVARGEVDRLAIFMPPGSAKSTYASALFPPWFLAHAPQKMVIAASHTQELAEHWGRRVRNLIAEQHARLGYRIAADSQAAGRWATDAGGEYFAAGVGGSVTGRRADLVVIDDPVRSREDAESETLRNRAWDWYRADLVTRLKPGAAIVLVQTRWHEDDLAGRILAAEGDRREGGAWEVIRLPAFAELLDPLGRAPGEPLWPEWESGAQLERKRSIIGPRDWLALYQQRPTAEDGTYFKAEWFRRYTDAPERMTIYMSGDFAVTEGGGDFTELAVWGVDSLENVYALDWWSGQTASDTWAAEFIRLIKRWRPVAFIGEAGPIRRAMEPLLSRMMRDERAYTVCEWLSHGNDKAANARSLQGFMANGRLYWPMTDWAERVKDQMLRFPGGKHDDAVDAASLFGRHIARVWGAVPEPMKPADPAEAMAAPPKIADMLRPTTPRGW